MTNATMPASVKDAAAQVRADLKRAFPGVKFSVRKGTGTAAAWVDVTWTDGPNDDMVQNVTDPYQRPGSPVEGVCLEREISKATLLQAQDLIRKELPEFALYDATGRRSIEWAGNVPVFYLGGWRFGGGSPDAMLASVADLLILNPRTGPGA